MVHSAAYTDALIGVRVRGPDDVGERLIDLLRGLMQEAVVAIFVGPGQGVIGCDLVSLGSCFAALIEPRDLFRGAVRTGAAGVIIAHNHPSGSTAPTPDDLAVTRRMILAGRILGIELLDHLIVGPRAWRSLRDSTNLWRHCVQASNRHAGTDTSESRPLSPSS